jgi:hypothetical protein
MPRQTCPPNYAFNSMLYACRQDARGDFINNNFNLEVCQPDVSNVLREKHEI